MGTLHDLKGSPRPSHRAPPWGWAKARLGHQPGSSWWGPWPSRAGAGRAGGILSPDKFVWCLLGPPASAFLQTLRFFFFSAFIKGKERKCSGPDVWAPMQHGGQVCITVSAGLVLDYQSWWLKTIRSPCLPSMQINYFPIPPPKSLNKP